MAAVSEFVVDEADVEAVQDEGDTASARLTFQVEHLEQRVIRYAPGRSGARTPEGRHELLYVVAGVGELELDGARYPVEQGTAALTHADRAMILERGQIVHRGTGAETDHASLRERYLGTPA